MRGCVDQSIKEFTCGRFFESAVHVGFAAIVLSILALAPLQATALPQRQDLAVFWTPLFGTLNISQKSYPFFAALGSTALYRYSLTPRFLLDVGYEVQNGGTKLVLHGPEFGVAYSLYGRPSFVINDTPVTMDVAYPLEVHIGLGGWIREHDFSTVFPASAALSAQSDDLVTKGNVTGMQVMAGLSFEWTANVRMLMRLRYLQGFTSNISRGTIRAVSPQLGLTARL